MKKQLRTALLVSLGLLSAGTAMANDAVIGALLGGGAGVLVGRSVGGRNGAVIGGALGAAAGAAIGSENRRDRVVEQRVDYYQPAPVYYEQAAYYPPQQVYYTQPVRVEQRPVYIIRGERDWDDRGHHRHHGRDRHDRGWEYRR
jgi:hypothetical protein